MIQNVLTGANQERVIANHQVLAEPEFDKYLTFIAVIYLLLFQIFLSVLV